jgi:membrane dipeptidase
MNEEEIAKLHEATIVVIGHTDIIGSDVDYHRATGNTAVLEKRHVPTLRAGGATVFLDHLGGDSRYGFLPTDLLTTTPFQRVMRMFDHAHHEAEESPSIILVDTVDDIHRAKRENKIALMLCLEGGAPLEHISYLRNLHRLGLRSLGLTHNWRNHLADGALERSNGGLTYFGAEVVTECEKLGVIVDVSHLSDRGTDDVIAITKRPFMASHSNARAVQPHIRNLSDAHIKAIAERGGVIGIHALNSMVAGEASTVDDMVRHVGHIIDVGGVDCVGIGPDLMENWQEDIYRKVTEGASSFMSIPVKKMNFAYPEGFRSLAETPNITASLARAGFKPEVIRKVLGGNFMRLFNEYWPGKAKTTTFAPPA